MEDKHTNEQRRSYITVCLLVGFMLVTTAYGKSTANERTSLLQVKENTVEREVLENREQQVKLIKNKDSNGQLTGFIGLDYAERLVSIYVPEREACFLIGGIMREVGTFDDDPYIDITLGSKVPNMKSAGTLLKYSVNDVHPVTNTELITKILSTNLNCNGTNTYWAERNGALSFRDQTTTKATSPVTAISQSRQKRYIDTIVTIVLWVVDKVLQVKDS